MKKTMKNFLVFLAILLTFTGCIIDPNMPSIGSGARTFSQAANAVGSTNSYWIGMVISILLAGGLALFARKKYNSLKANDKFKQDWIIPAATFIVILVELWLFIVHPIYNQMYY